MNQLEEQLNEIEKLANNSGASGVSAIVAVSKIRDHLNQIEPVVGCVDSGTLGDVEKMAIARRLVGLVKHKPGGKNKFQVAASLGIERSTLDRKIRRYGL